MLLWISFTFFGILRDVYSELNYIAGVQLIRWAIFIAFSQSVPVQISAIRALGVLQEELKRLRII